MKPITHNRLRKLLKYDPDSGLFTWRTVTSNRVKVGQPAGTITELGYIRITLDNVRYAAHRLAWFYVYKKWPPHEIDHINSIRDDNRIANLRLATRAENVKNSKTSSLNTSGVKGVNWHKQHQKWCARISHNGKRIHVGLFLSLDDAKCAVEKARKLYHKEFTRHE